MKISAIYIAKNEAKTIARSLDSIRDAVDELILVDTGSTDDTIKIFQSYGGRVYQQLWQDDFSAPRNYGLSKAKGDWLILLDADEYFSPETAGNIRKVLQQVPAKCLGINIKKYNIDGVGGQVQDFIYDLRIVRNVKHLNYQGIIHESLFIKDKPLLQYVNISEQLLTLFHTGYSKELGPQKARRNLELLQKDVAQGRPIEEVYRYLYDCYHGLGDTEKAIEYAKLDVARGRQPVSYASRCYRGLLAHYNQPQNRLEMLERLKWTEIAVHDFPEVPEFHAEYGAALAQWYRFDQAVVEMEKALVALQNYQGAEATLLTEDSVPLLQAELNKYRALAQRAAEIKISACAIARDEAENMPEWLEKSQAYADEVIVVDTGSQDNTLAILREARVNYLEIAWQDDFSYAKNIAIDKAVGDWIVFNDIDETFYSPESVRGFLAYLEVNKPEIESVMVPLADIDLDDDNKEISRNDVIRAFKNRDDIRYHGKIHESIYEAQAIDYDKIFLADERLLIKHTGYSQRIIEKKLRRNLGILLAEGGEAGVTPDKYHYLADCYWGLKEHEKALNYALLAINSGYKAVGQEVEMYSMALYIMEQQGYAAEDKLVVINAGLEECSDAPDLFGYRGLVRYAQQKYQEAYLDLHKAYDIYAANMQDGSQSHATYFNWIVVRCIYTMAYCAQRLGLQQNARVMAEEALEMKPEDKGAQEAYELICGAQQAVKGQVQGQIKLSACVIVKNEAKNIQLWLDNVSAFADEVIVVDTGSTDETISLAQQSGATVYTIPWENDFAAAKNFAIEKATGDWIIFTDADELFVQPEQVRPYLTSIHQQSELAIICTLVNIDMDAAGAEIDRFETVRAFRNLPELRYQGRIHESISYQGKAMDTKLMLQAPQALLINHTGYSYSVVRTKAQRNLELLLPDGDVTKVVPENYRYVAEALYILDQDDLAIEFAQKALEQENHTLDVLINLYVITLRMMERSGYSQEQRLAVIKAGLHRYPAYPDMWAYMGLLYMEQEQYQAALKQLERAISLQTAAEAKGQPLLNSRFSLLSLPVDCAIGICHIKLGNMEVGLKKLSDVLHKNPYNEQAIVSAVDGFDMAGIGYFSQLDNLLFEIYGTDASNAELLVKILVSNGVVGVKNRFLQRCRHCKLPVIAYADLAERAFLSGEYAEAFQYALANVQEYSILLAVSMMNEAADLSRYEMKQRLALLSPYLQQMVEAFWCRKEAGRADYKALVNAAGFADLAAKLLAYGSKEVQAYWRQQSNLYGEEQWLDILPELRMQCHYPLEQVVQQLEQHKQSAETVKELAKYIAGEDVVTRIQLYNSYFDRQQDGLFLLEVLMELEDAQLLAYYGKEQQLGLLRGKFYLKTGRYDLSSVELAHLVAVNAKLVVAALRQLHRMPDAKLSELIATKFINLTQQEMVQNMPGKTVEERAVARILKAANQKTVVTRAGGTEVVDTAKGTIGHRIFANVKKEYLAAHKGHKGHLKVYFLPYNAAMWDALETVWQAAVADSNCEAVVMPLPYYDKDGEGKFIKGHWDGDRLPEHVPIQDYRQVNLAEKYPDIIFIHNPYDYTNTVTSVHPDYYSNLLMKNSEMLVYIPYFVTDDNKDTVESISIFADKPVFAHADIIVLQSEKQCQTYMSFLTKLYGEKSRRIWQEKLRGWGSPKLDGVRYKKLDFTTLPTEWQKKLLKTDGTVKKVVMYGTGLSAVLRYETKLIDKIERTFKFFREKKDEVMLLWRPHPLIPATIISMRPDLYARYMSLIERYKAEDWGIFDDTADLDRAIALSDAYYGDGSSLTKLFQTAKKPVMIENVDI